MQHKDDIRTVFFVSDRTGKTAEYIGESLLSQFDGISFEQQSFSFVNSSAEAARIAGQIRQNALATGRQPLVFSTLVDEALQEMIASTGACVISLFNAFIDPLEKAWGSNPRTPSADRMRNTATRRIKNTLTRLSLPSNMMTASRPGTMTRRM